MGYLVMVAAVALVVSGPLGAQQMPPVAMHSHPSRNAAQRYAAALHNAPERKPYVVTGAVIGAASATILCLSRYHPQSPNGYLDLRPLQRTLVAAGCAFGGGATGGFTGYLVSFLFIKNYDPSAVHESAR